MIFNIGEHISLIIQGFKTQTRRSSDRYQVGKTYSLQFGWGKKGLPIGRILITAKSLEARQFDGPSITSEDALAEGGYTQDEFYQLYRKIDPAWMARWVYTFEFIPQSSSGSAKK